MCGVYECEQDDRFGDDAGYAGDHKTPGNVEHRLSKGRSRAGVEEVAAYQTSVVANDAARGVNTSTRVQYTLVQRQPLKNSRR